MNRTVEIPLNLDYLITPDLYPRQVKRLQKLIQALVCRGVDPTLRGIQIVGESNNEVIDNISEQIHKKIGKLCGKQILTYFGDSAGGPFSIAAHKSLENGDRTFPFIVGAGGTRNNLANSLYTADIDVTANIASGITPHNEIDLKIRQAIITTFDKDDVELDSLTSPWIGSVGTGIGGRIIHEWEERPRTMHPILRLMLSTWSVINDTITNQKGDDKKKADDREFPINADSITTLRYLGFCDFGPDYNAPDKDGFFHQTFKSKFGLEAMSRIAVFTAMGHIAAVNSWLWTNLPDEKQISKSDFWRIVAEIKPQHVFNPTLRIDGRDNIIHMDGYPLDLKNKMKMEEDGHAEIELSTTSETISFATAFDEAA